ncbi:phosphohistidine phosphatase SixA [Ilyobacter polytropus]|uniref:Phosphohistidine phosphatase, SixA n=1 Tax=Ilyobacter polytropus (strain ATCC 51220 / DSM 2926 / LMG 16218 / CuHBu1) TaxID=572544 RepID=E3HD89_ILYPC|nr:phosphohistidine phosphatase SixA [Ilyobacter polytropus]ADO84089.1 putative phosphohistidine phosphatase, SixA [Ilyobacter polytropus DSM 2926]
MTIYLARHGEAVSLEKNPERPLSQEGKAEVEKMAHLLETMGLKVNKIMHSGKKRAEETARIFSENLCDGKTFVSKRLNPNDSVEEFFKKLKNEDKVMYVGHLPFMERLASFILTGDEKKVLIKIKTSGVLCLVESQGRWCIKWLIAPDL